MGLFGFGRSRGDQQEYAVSDDGTDYDIQDGDYIDGADVYYGADEENVDEYVEDNSDFSPGYYEQQAAVCGACNCYQQVDEHGNVYCGCPDNDF